MKKVMVLSLIIFLTGCQLNEASVAPGSEMVEEVGMENEEESGIGLPERLELLDQFETHTDKIWTIDSNSELFVAGSVDGSISIWDYDGNLIHHKKLHSRCVEEVILADAIYTISDDNHLLKTDLETFESEDLYVGITKEFDINKEQNQLAISDGQAVKVFQLDSFTLINEFPWTNGCFDLRISNDGQFLYNVGHEGLVEKYEIETGDVVRNYEGLSADVHCLELSSDNSFLVAGATDQNVALWQEDGILITKYYHLDGLYDVALSEDDRYVASVGVDQAVVVLDLHTMKMMPKVSLPCELHTVTFVYDRIVTGGYDYLVYLIGHTPGREKITAENLINVEELKSVLAHDTPVFDLAISHDNAMVVSSGWDDTIKLWDAETLELIQSVAFDEIGVFLAFTPDDSEVIIKGELGNLGIWSLGENRIRYESKNEALEVGSFGLSEDGSLLALGCIRGKILLKKYPSLETVFKYQGKEHWVTPILIQDEMLYFSYAGSTEEFKVAALSYETGELKYETEGHSGYNYDVEISKDVLISSGADALIKFWDLETGDFLYEFSEHTAKVMDVDVSEDGSWMVSGSAHGFTTRLWDLKEKRQVKVIRPLTEVQCVEISTDESFIVTTGEDGLIRVYGVMEDE